MPNAYNQLCKNDWLKINYQIVKNQLCKDE